MVDLGLVVALVIARALPIEEAGEDRSESNELVESEFRRGRRGKGENRPKNVARVSERGGSSWSDDSDSIQSTVDV